ncbi:single-stranded DNA-binding protein [Cellulomonas endophytica]|uniref:single-stranded DNA-binding protein n=1 Tax=Cellulomonas endophytica TaxID=2494735 RepID=UPI0010128F58|nr:single-stranded DNA-binding protein [Cellulomonas endophytica]
MSNGTSITVTGWVGSDVRPGAASATGTDFASFRLGSTRRWRDVQKGEWREDPTMWFTVKVWRQAAENLRHSLRKGDPVVVEGRLATDQWEGPDGVRTDLVIVARAVGHDLTLGTAAFERTAGAVRGAPPADVSGLVELPPEDDGDERVSQAAAALVAEVDEALAGTEEGSDLDPAAATGAAR